MLTRRRRRRLRQTGGRALCRGRGDCCPQTALWRRRRAAIYDCSGDTTIAGFSATGVRVQFRLSRTGLNALKRTKRLRFNVSVTLGARTFTTNVTLTTQRR